MIKTVLVHGFWNEFLFFYRAKFAVAAVNGIRMSFFRSAIGKSNGKIISFPA